MWSGYYDVIIEYSIAHFIIHWVLFWRFQAFRLSQTVTFIPVTLFAIRRLGHWDGHRSGHWDTTCHVWRIHLKLRRFISRKVNSIFLNLRCPLIEIPTAAETIQTFRSTN